MPRFHFSRPALLRPAPLRKRLWQGGIALAVMVITIAATNQFIPREKSLTADMLGLDFLPFYTSGLLVRSGCSDLLYHLPTIHDVENELAEKNNLDLGKSVGPYWNPPFYAWVFVPFSYLPYREALLCWTLVNVLALLGAIELMRRMFPPGTDWRLTSLVSLLVLVSMPFIQAISHGQNTFGSLLLVAAIATAWRQKRALIAGVCCGLLTYKPQLAALLAIVMTLDLGWRVAAGVAGIGATFLLITARTLPGTISGYVHQLPLNLHAIQVEHTYLWERHVTLKGFWRLLLQGRGAGETSWLVTALTLLCGGAIVCGLIAAVVKMKRQPIDNPWSGQTAQLRRDRLIALTIVASPLLMPFYFDYDLLLLAVPATLLSIEPAAAAPELRRCRRDRWLIGVFTLLFLWLMINPGLANSTHVNGSVILLSSVCAFLIARAAEPNESLPIFEQRALPLASHRIAA